jgi:ATP-binding cassette subfamily B protein
MPGRLSPKQKQERPTLPAWPTIRRALGLYRTQKGAVATLLGTIVITSLVGLGPPLILREIIDGAFRRNDKDYLNFLVMCMVATVLFTAFMGVWQTYLSNSIGQRVVYELRDMLYRHLSRMSPGCRA